MSARPSTFPAVADADRELEAEIDRLYGVPSEDFVSERDALARRLRSERRRQEAKEVGALRKPSRAAWAINRVARDQPRLAEDVGSAGDALRAAQAGLAEGGGPDELRAAAQVQRAAVDGFADAARDLLGSGGEDTLRRIRETLLAAATDADLAERVRGGRVVREQAPAGFGPWVPAPATPEGSTRAKPARPSGDRAEEAGGAERRAEEEERARGAEEERARGAEEERARGAEEEDDRRRAEAQARIREARGAEARAHEEAAQLAGALDEARVRRDDAREARDQAQHELDGAEREVTELERAARRARAEAGRASARLRELEATGPG